MKSLNNLLILLAVLFLAGCQQQATNNETEEEQPVEVQEESGEVTSAEYAVLNANLASEEQLGTVGLPADLTAQILENRPFLDMMDLHNLLSTEMDSAALAGVYGKLFVPFNINTTDEDNFKLIPGVGDRMAHEFEEYRPYTKIQQFRKEIGKYVDETEVARLEQYIFVPIELNTASEEDILALPGVGKRMAHEFEEYRPYTSIEQFRKEIGKYVDDKELARLERLVYLKSE